MQASSANPGSPATSIILLHEGFAILDTSLNYYMSATPFRGWPFRRIDYIFVRYGEHGRPALDIAVCTQIFDEPTGGVQARDYFGLMADLTVLNVSSSRWR